MKTYIYSLDCPTTKQPKYIGKTINPENRLAQHNKDKDNTKKSAWITGLKKRGLKPIFTIVDVIEDESWGFWETFYIDYYKFLGFNLKNHKSGGIGGAHSQETKNKISLILKGKPKSAEHKSKAIKNLKPGNNKGVKISDKQRAQLFGGLNNYIKNNGFPNTKTKIETVVSIKNDLKLKQLTYSKIAEKNYTTIHIVSDIARGKTWKKI